MSVANKSIVFLLLTFIVSWSVAIGGWALSAHNSPLTSMATLFAMMMGPAIAGVICAFAFEKGRRVEALGLKFRPNWWWLGAWLIGLALSVLSIAVTVLFSDRTLVDPVVNVRAMMEAQGQDTSQLDAVPFLGLIMIVQAALLGPAINSVLTLSEELGWRGYLHHMWRASGFWRASLATGVIWGVWHAPAILLYGHNYPEQRGLGVALFTLFCVLLSPLFTLVRDRGASVWAAGILHGTINAMGGLTAIVLSNPAFPWNGIVGIGGFVALALALAAIAAMRPGTPSAPAA
jgi:membrane protease YdiL (CAAX protease family)